MFEGDIVQPDKVTYNGCVGVIRFGEYEISGKEDEVIRFPKQCGFYIEWQGLAEKALTPSIMYWLDRVGVIGNIHDNPELLKSKEVLT
jgi:hypothetical protein